MAYYNNAHVHYDGALILYQRDLKTAVPNSPNHRVPKWYMKITLPKLEKPINRSTKCTKYEDAYEYARKEYRRIETALEQGHTLTDFTFEQHWDDWYKRGLTNKTWAADRERWHQMYANRYFKPYFRHSDGSSMKLNEITLLVAQGYWDWRINLWQSEKGERLKKYNPKRRGAKTTTTNNAKATPSQKTLDMEKGALNQIFRDARERGRLQQDFKLQPPKINEGDRRRPHFDNNEYGRLISYLRSYKECIGHFKEDRVNAYHKLHRIQLYHFVLFMLNSGLRPGEAYKMRWRDITFDQIDIESGKTIAVVSVRKNTKKRQNRDVQTQPTANSTLRTWKTISPFTKPDDFVWFGQDKDADGKPKQITELNTSFQSFLKRIPVEGHEDGMLYSKEGDPRVVYSLRHTYATMRIERGNIKQEDLAINMGCERVQIEKHYSHADSHSRRSEIVKMKPKAPKKQMQDDVTSTANQFINEAIKRNRNGEIDDATLLAIIKSVKV